MVIGPTPPGYRRDRTHFVFYIIEVHIAAQFSVLVTVHADIDHHGTFLDPVMLDHFGYAGGSDQDIRFPADSFDVFCLGMSDRYRCVFG